MKLLTLKQYMNMSKPALIRKITKALRAMPKAKLARLCYNITKAKLPRLKVTKRKALPRRKTKRIFIKKDDRYVMKKFSRKQLAAQRLFAKRARAGTLRKPRRQKHISRKELMASRKRWLG